MCGSFDGIFHKWLASVVLFFAMVGVVSWASVYLGSRAVDSDHIGESRLANLDEFLAWLGRGNRVFTSSKSTISVADVARTEVASPITTIAAEQVTDKSDLQRTNSSGKRRLKDEHQSHSVTFVRRESTKSHRNTVSSSSKSPAIGAFSTLRNIATTEPKKITETTAEETEAVLPLSRIIQYFTRRQSSKTISPHTTEMTTSAIRGPLWTSSLLTTSVNIPKSEDLIGSFKEIFSTFEGRNEENKEVSTSEIREISSDRLEAVPTEFYNS